MKFKSHWHFLNFVFLGNIGLENALYDILKGENAFLADKKKVNPWFWSKYGHFSNFFF